MLTADNLRGNWATLLLPINEDESINFNKLSDEIDAIIGFKVDGIYSNGTAGEFHNQTDEEFMLVNQLLAEKCHRVNMKFQVGASHPSPIISLERVRKSLTLKPDAIQIILPDWVKTTAVEDLLFLRRIADAADGIPLVLYNPPRAKKVLAPADYQKFKDALPELIGVKLLSGDAGWVEQIKLHAGHLSIFVPGHMLASGVKNGIAAGAYSNVACIHPNAAQQWWQLMQTDIESALDIEQRIQAFFKQVIAPLQQREYSNPALDKFLAAVGGWSDVGTKLRWPYRWIPESEVAAARIIAKKIIPEFFPTATVS